MDVILLERIEKLGQMGDVVSVKPGFARNYLLPQKKAMRATEANRQSFDGQRAQLETVNLERRSEAESVADLPFQAAVVVAVLPGTTGILGQNAVLVLSIPFLLLGLTVIHTLSRRTPNPGMVLVAIYFALFLFAALINISLPILALLVLLGIAEQWTSLRQRFAAPGANQEDE